MGVSRVSVILAAMVLMFPLLQRCSVSAPWPAPSPHGTDLSVVQLAVLPSIIGMFTMLFMLLYGEVELEGIDEGGKGGRGARFFCFACLDCSSACMLCNFLPSVHFHKVLLIHFPLNPFPLSPFNYFPLKSIFP